MWTLMGPVECPDRESSFLNVNIGIVECPKIIYSGAPQCGHFWGQWRVS